MDDPVFRMRAKVAKKANGHVFEERFMKLSGLKLALAYRQAIRDETEDLEIQKVWVKKIDTLFERLYMFTNPQMFKNVEDLKELQGLREEVKPEDFAETWEEILKVIPNEIIVEEPQNDLFGNVPEVDPETEEMLTGFVPYKKRKEGDRQ